MSFDVADPAESRTRPAEQLQAWAAAVSMVSGFLLFLVCRKLVWGREESITDGWIWTLALAPYFLFFLARYLRGAGFGSGWDADFIAIWTCSLLLLAIGRWTSWADVFEDPIYAHFPPGLIRYAILSIIYTGLAFALVTGWRAARQQTTRSTRFAIPRPISYLAGVVVFCCSVFLIAV